MKPLIIAGRQLKSRLFVGTGKYPSPRVLSESLDASGCELVTVALRRVNFSEPDPTLSAIDFEKYLVVPNTSGAKNAEEAVRLARLSRAASGLTLDQARGDSGSGVSAARPRRYAESC